MYPQGQVELTALKMSLSEERWKLDSCCSNQDMCHLSTTLWPRTVSRAKNLLNTNNYLFLVRFPSLFLRFGRTERINMFRFVSVSYSRSSKSTPVSIFSMWLQNLKQIYSPSRGITVTLSLDAYFSLCLSKLLSKTVPTLFSNSIQLFPVLLH